MCSVDYWAALISAVGGCVENIEGLKNAQLDAADPIPWRPSIKSNSNSCTLKLRASPVRASGRQIQEWRVQG